MAFGEPGIGSAQEVPVPNVRVLISQNQSSAAQAADEGGDHEEALKQLRPSAEQGDADAQHNLGVMYGAGRGVAQDQAEAIRWNRLAAAQGHPRAQTYLGNAYANGQGVAQDRAEAVRLYRLAAAQGDAGAQNGLGFAYDTGQGVVQDQAEALRWYQLAAAQGHARAQYNIGVMYAGGRGVAQDQTEAMRWYRLAAAQGHVGAQSQLGTAAYTGRQGALEEWWPPVPDSSAEDQYAAGKIAFQWGDYWTAAWLFRSAAIQGHALAQGQIGALYALGRGVAQDDVQAYKWSTLAASRLPRGDDARDVMSNRDIVAARMTATQIEEAQRLVRDWRPE